MRKLFYLVLMAGLVYGAVRYVPSETKTKVLASIGLDNFLRQTLPQFLRERLSIPENPIFKRKKLLDQLSETLGGIGRELEAVVPAESGDRPPARSLLPPAKDIRARVEKSREFLAQSELVLEELEAANPGQGIVRQAALRLLDIILPSSARPGEGESVGGGVMGDSDCKCLAP